jgi:uncharacterized protein (TIGR02246 family)
MRRRSILAATTALIAGAILLVGCGGGGRPSSRAGSDAEILKNAGAEWDRLFDSRDAAALAALYAEDVISMPFNAPTIHGRAALQADFERFFAGNTGRHQTLVDEILTGDDWAIERARYVLTYSPKAGGPEVKESGRHVVCRRRSGDAWRIAWEIWNTDTPPQ